jgi:O-methyltransferase
VRWAVECLGLLDDCIIRKGWLHETLPVSKPESIAVLRIDCDWYDPVMCVYRELEPLVSIGAPIIIDDYDAWEGCRLATHAYLTKKALPWKIRSAPGSHGAWMIKEKPYVIKAEAA